MQLINPSEISARILTMLDESDQWVVLVSPYMKISKWYKFLNKLNELKTRNILAEVYVREDPSNIATYRDLDQLAVQYKKIPHLHSKLYLNERYGIVTSMNLLLSSEINSLEIGYVTENRTEYNELLRYFHRFIHIGEPAHCITRTNEPIADINKIMNNINEGLKSTTNNSWSWFAQNRLHISTGRNNYKVSINDGYLNITASLRFASGTKPKDTQHPYLIAKKVEDLTAMKVNVHPGTLTDTLQLFGQAQQTLKSSCITGILETDVASIMESVRNFIDATTNLVG